MKLILGSSSPRRKEILSFFTLPFVQDSPTFDEESLLFGGNPASFVEEMAEKKALTLAHKHTDPILTADTVVYCHKKLYMKPKDPEDAFRMVSELGGNWAEVYTGVCVYHKGKAHVKAEMSKILLHQLSPEQIRKYHAAFDCFDKAGGFYIQKSGSIILKEIIGCFYNIMGLPITTTRELLLRSGINLWDYLN